MTINDQELRLLGASGIRRENHGFGWQEGASNNWINNRFLVFQDDEGLCIVDVSQKLILLNQVFAGFSKSPNDNKWAAIRYRPTTKSQEQLTGQERDILWFIEPELLAAHSSLSMEGNPFKHVESVQLNGIVIARPMWSDDSKAVVVVVYSGDRIEAILFDATSHKQIQSIRLTGARLTREQVLSPWFLPEVNTSISKAVQLTGLLHARSIDVGSQSSTKEEPAAGNNDVKPPERNDFLTSPTPDPHRSTKHTNVGPWLAGAIVFLILVRFMLKSRS